MPTLHQVAWDHQNYQFTVNLLEKVGTEARMLVANLPIGAAIKEISYTGKVEFESMMGSDRQSQDTTDGIGSYEATASLEKWGADFLNDTIAELDGHGLATVRFDIACIPFKTGIDPIADLISLARLTEHGTSSKSGKDPNVVSLSFFPHRVYVRGKDLFGKKRV